MVEKLKESVLIPKWAVGTIITVFLAIISAIFYFGSAYGKIATKSEEHSERIEKLEEKKADAKTLERFESFLIRIENKLDSHIEKENEHPR